MLSEGTKTFLAIMRDANAQKIELGGALVAVLKARLGVSHAEMHEVLEILKADLRERLMMQPGAEEILDLIQPED